MNRAASRFQFRPALNVAMVIALAILVTLGNWQLQRRQWKIDLIEKTQTRVNATPIPFDDALTRHLAGEDMTYTPVFLDGVFSHQQEAHVFGTYDAMPGYYVFTPLTSQGDGDRAIYINRGFAPLAMKPVQTRPGGLVAGPVAVIGLFRAAEKPSGVAALVQPADSPERNEWHQRNPPAFAATAGFETASVYIDSNGADNPGEWPKGATTRLEFNNRHLEYALTWFGLAAALIGVWFFFSLRK